MKNKTEISFYHLTTTPLLNSLPKILEKTLIQNKRTIIVFPNEQKMEEMNQYLWSFSTKIVIPHGSSKDEFPEEQPIYLTCANDNPNGATILVMIEDIEPSNYLEYQKCVYIFDGNNEDELALARAKWKKYNAQELSLIYWKQNLKGGWEQISLK